jgi:two-component system response regulator VanR
MYENLKGVNVLYIEDDEYISKHFMDIFKKLGMKAYYADSYDSAVKYFDEGKVSLIVTDINLPEKNGIDIIKYIRSKDKNIKIIVTSGYTDKDYLLDSIEYDVAKYFVKPYSEIDFLDYIDNILTSEKDSEDDVYINNNLYYSFAKKSFLLDGNRVKLSSQEITLIEYLLKNKDKVVKYDELQKEVSVKNKQASMDTLRTLIKNIRKKTFNDIIETLSGVGYRINTL